MDHLKFGEMQKIFQRKNASNLERKAVVKAQIKCACSRRQCCYNKHNHRILSVLGERTTEEQNYYKLVRGKINENNGKDHLVVTEGKNYQWRLYYINKGIEHNVAKNA